MARATSRRRDFGNLRTARRKESERSTCKVSLEIARVALHLPGFPITLDLGVGAAHEQVDFLLSDSVLSKRIVVRVDGDGAERDNLSAVKDADILAVGGAPEQGGKIYPRLRGR